MSEHRANVAWHRGDQDFDPATYSRVHSWRFDGGATVAASSAPEFQGDPSAVDPEEAFVAALSSCHMLFFLVLAAKRKLVIDHYEDDAVGTMTHNADGKTAITEVVLRPKITFAPGIEPPAEQLEKLHHRAHDLCFIANSVRTEVRVEPR